MQLSNVIHLVLISAFVGRVNFVDGAVSGSGKCSREMIAVRTGKTATYHPAAAFDSVNITCEPGHNAQLQSVICRNDRDNEQYTGKLLEGKRKAVVDFGQLNVTSGGVYVCTLKLIGGSTQQVNTEIYVRSLINVPDSKMRVDVSDHDQFELKATGATVVRGEDIIITCPVFGYPMPKITWKKDDHDIVNDKHVTVKNNQVVILKAEKEQAGIYRCTAQNTIWKRNWISPGVSSGEDVIEDTMVTLERVVRIKGELAWVWPLLVIVMTVIALIITIVICELRNRRKERMLLNQQEENED